MRILPAILAHTKKELEQQLSRLKWAKEVQLDVMDGRFVPGKTYSLKETARKLKGKKVQAHLMVENPERYLPRLGFATEIIYHAKTGKELIERIQRTGKKAGIAFNPEVRADKYERLLKKADVAQVMTVKPGKMGSKFLPEQLKKIKHIKKINPKLKVGVDGGVSSKNMAKIKKAGADFAAAGSAIQKADNPKEAYKKLQEK